MITIILSHKMFGLERKHFVVPEGYELLVGGVKQEGDKHLNFHTKTWEVVNKEDVGFPIDLQETCVCRKMDSDWHSKESYYYSIGIKNKKDETEVELELNFD